MCTGGLGRYLGSALLRGNQVSYNLPHCCSQCLSLLQPLSWEGSSVLVSLVLSECCSFSPFLLSGTLSVQEGSSEYTGIPTWPLTSCRDWPVVSLHSETRCLDLRTAPPRWDSIPTHSVESTPALPSLSNQRQDPLSYSCPPPTCAQLIWGICLFSYPNLLGGDCQVQGF